MQACMEEAELEPRPPEKSPPTPTPSLAPKKHACHSWCSSRSHLPTCAFESLVIQRSVMLTDVC